MINNLSGLAHKLFEFSLGNTVATKSACPKDLGRCALEELSKARRMVGMREPNGAKSKILKSCWYLDKMVGLLENKTGIQFEKSSEQSDYVRQKIETSSDWINTSKEGSSYKVLQSCVAALEDAIGTLLEFSYELPDTVEKSTFEDTSELMIYKAFRKK